MTYIPSLMFSDAVDDAGFDLMFLTVKDGQILWGEEANVTSKCVHLCTVVFQCIIQLCQSIYDSVPSSGC